MKRYDKSTNVLTYYQNEKALPKMTDIKIKSENLVEQLDSYLSKGVKDDVFNIFLPELLRRMNLTEDKLWIKEDSVMIEQATTDVLNDLIRNENKGHADYNALKYSKYRLIEDKDWRIYVTFGVAGAGYGRNPIKIMSIPSVNENGIIKHDGKEYAFVHMLEQNDGLSYNDNANTQNPPTLQLKTANNSIILSPAKKMGLDMKLSNIRISENKKKATFIDVISAMAINEGYDTEYIWNLFKESSIVNMFNGKESDRQLHVNFAGGIDSLTEYIAPLLMCNQIRDNGSIDDRFSTKNFREELNETLSLSRAINRVLAKDVKSEITGEIIAKRDQIVTDYLVKEFEKNHVYCIYVKSRPNISGQFLAQDVNIFSFPKGIKMSKALREQFPELGNVMYLDRDMRPKDGMLQYLEKDRDPKTGLSVRRVITEELLDLMEAAGYEYVDVTSKEKGNDHQTIYFYEEILSNRQFKDESGKWKYLNNKNILVNPPTGYTTFDFAALLSFCTKLFNGMYIDRVQNTDVNFKKKLSVIGNQYHKAFQYACQKASAQMNQPLLYVYRNDRYKFVSDDDEMEPKFYPWTKYFWDYLYKESKCVIQLSGEVLNNPLIYQSTINKANVFMKSKHSVSASQRQISINSFGRIDPYEIPQSGKIGIVNNLTSYSSIDKDGNILTPYYRLIHNGSSIKIDTERPVYLNVTEEAKFNIADICALQIDDNNNVTNTNDYVLCRAPSKNTIETQTFSRVPISDIDYVNINDMQSISWNSSLVPFLNSNDSARATFGIAQCKAVKGLCYPEEPLVRTKATKMIPLLNNKFAVIADKYCRIDVLALSPSSDSYIVNYTYFNALKDYTSKGKLEDEKGRRYNIGRHLTEDEMCGRVGNFDVDDLAIDMSISSEVKGVHDLQVPSILYGTNSVTVFRLNARVGDKLKPGSVIIDSNFISRNGELMYGVNTLIGYICDSHNYEDGIRISESYANRISSYHLHSEDIRSNDRYGNDVALIHQYNEKFEPFKQEITKTRPTTMSGKNTKGFKLREAKGFYYDQIPRENKMRRTTSISVQFVSADPCEVGDKLCNRHGNKGTVSVISRDKDMPRLNNGIPLDLTFNPLGTVKRMNMGQIQEGQINLCAKVLGIKIDSESFNGATGTDIEELLSLTVDLMNSEGDPSSVLSAYNYGEDFNNHCIENINEIRKWKGCFNKRGTTRVWLPENGRFTETEIMIAVEYIAKLTQESAEKIHARAGEVSYEPYSELSDSPTHGSANGGGQRFGTMEMDALMAYGVDNYIYELMNLRGDNAIEREQFNLKTYLAPSLANEYKLDRKGQRRSITQLLYSLLAVGIMPECNENEFVNLSYNNAEELKSYKAKNTLLASENYNKNVDQIIGSDEEENEHKEVETSELTPENIASATDALRMIMRKTSESSKSEEVVKKESIDTGISDDSAIPEQLRNAIADIRKEV